MATYTTKLNLKKPAGTDPVLIADINTNMNTLDTAAIPSGGATGQVLVKSSATDYATEWAAVGRSNPNMLINRNFAVNQTGTVVGTAFAANGYIADCWQAWGGNVTLLSGGGVILASGVQLMQRMAKYHGSMLGKTFTVSIRTGGVIKTATLAFPSAVSGADIMNTVAVAGVGNVGFGFLYSSGGTIINGISRNYIPFVDIVTSAAIQIDDTYLEIGKCSTLDNAPNPDYSEELFKGSFRRLRFGNATEYCALGTGIAVSTTSLYLAITLMKPMRCPPTISYGETVMLRASDGSLVSLTAATLNATPNTTCLLLCSGSAALTPGAYDAFTTPGGYLELNADLL